MRTRNALNFALLLNEVSEGGLLSLRITAQQNIGDTRDCSGFFGIKGDRNFVGGQEGPETEQLENKEVFFGDKSLVKG
jgi:hypothetical protein